MSINIPHYSNDPEMQNAFERSYTQAVNEGIAIERNRITSIMALGTSPQVDRAELATHLAFSTDVSAEEARRILSLAAQDSPKVRTQVGNLFADAMAALGNPDIRAELDEPRSEHPEAIAARIASAMNPQQTGAANRHEPQ